MRAARTTRHNRPTPLRALLPGLAALALTPILGPMQLGGAAQGRTPTATLVATSTLELTGAVDSNSPALWQRDDGRQLLHVLTSVAGQPSLASGSRLTRLGTPQTVTFVNHPGHGVWMEAVVSDEGGTWYGYYHNEIPADVCGRPDLVIPRIGAARSTDEGATWENLGIVLEAPPGAYQCGTSNRYFAGGVGDLSVMLDEDRTTLYLFFSQYSRDPTAQGVAVARLLWAQRDEPVGGVDIWVDGAWLPPEPFVDDGAEDAPVAWHYPAGTPLVQPARPWHDADPLDDAFWGASVHWNTALQQYVMLLNRAKDDDFTQEGVYVSYAPSLDDPRLWSAPQRILAGGRWYPQVLGLEPGDGTDKQAGARARFFMSGTSTSFIDFAYR